MKIISIWAGFTSILFALLTINAYKSGMKKFFTNSSTKTASCWLSAGIFCGFVGSVVDSSYWQIAWITDFLNLEIAEIFFKYGVVINVPFRNFALIIAAFCHLKAFLILYDETDENNSDYDYKKNDKATFITMSFSLISLVLLLTIIAIGKVI